MYYIGISVNNAGAAGGADIGIVNGQTKSITAREKICKCGNITEACRNILKKTGLAAGDIGAIGVGMSARCGSIAEDLKNSFNGIPVYCERKANAAAAGENQCGAGGNVPSLILVMLDEEVECGMIIENKIYHGVNNSDAALAHMVINYGGKECGCGRKGCFGAYVSTKGLMGSCGKFQCAQDVFKAASEGDTDARAMTDSYVGFLASGVTDIINIFQPDALILGGEVSRAGDLLLNPLNAIVEREKYARHSSETTKIKTASLDGTDAAIIGAAMLGAQER